MRHWTTTTTEYPSWFIQFNEYYEHSLEIKGKNLNFFFWVDHFSQLVFVFVCVVCVCVWQQNGNNRKNRKPNKKKTSKTCRKVRRKCNSNYVRHHIPAPFTSILWGVVFVIGGMKLTDNWGPMAGRCHGHNDVSVRESWLRNIIIIFFLQVGVGRGEGGNLEGRVSPGTTNSIAHHTPEIEKNRKKKKHQNTKL